MKTKVKIEIILSIIAIILMIANVIVSILIYHDSQIDAINGHLDDGISITSRLAVVKNDNVEIFLGKTDDGKYIVAPLVERDNKYKYGGEYHILDSLDMDDTKYFTVYRSNYRYLIIPKSKLNKDINNTAHFIENGAEFVLIVKPDEYGYEERYGAKGIWSDIIP